MDSKVNYGKTLLIEDDETLELTRTDEDYNEFDLEDGLYIRLNSKRLLVLTDKASKTYLPTDNPFRLLAIWFSKRAR